MRPGPRGRLPLDTKDIITVTILAFDVRLEHFISDIAATAAEIAASPKVSTPKPFAQRGKFVEEQIRTFPFHPLDQAADLPPAGESRP